MIKPSRIHLHKQSKQLELLIGGQSYYLTAELLRVYSPSAEVRGHGGQNTVLVTGKMDVVLLAVQPVGNYGIRCQFDDSHNSGIYTWSYLCSLAKDADILWQAYLDKLELQQKSRDPHITPLKF